MKKFFDFLREIDPLVHLVFVVAIVSLAWGYFSLNNKVGGLGQVVLDIRDSLNKIQIFQLNEKDVFFSPSPTPSASGTLETKKIPLGSSQKSITYINLGGPFSTQSSDWVGIASTDSYIDLAKEYGKNAYIDWEGSISISDISGKVYARLYDVTNNIAVNGSELVVSKDSSTRVSSGKLYLWAGHNLYRVQIKSTPPYTATFDSGRIKIVY